MDMISLIAADHDRWLGRITMLNLLFLIILFPDK